MLGCACGSFRLLRVCRFLWCLGPVSLPLRLVLNVCWHILLLPPGPAVQEAFGHAARSVGAAAHPGADESAEAVLAADKALELAVSVAVVIVEAGARIAIARGVARDGAHGHGGGLGKLG